MSEVADDLAEIASLVRELRKRKGITLQALADGIRRSVGFVSQVERGLSRPAVDDLVAISQVLGVPATYFFCSPKTQASPWVTRPGERRTLAYARGASDNLVSPRLGGAFFMLETCLEAGADSGERDLLDLSLIHIWSCACRPATVSRFPAICAAATPTAARRRSGCSGYTPDEARYPVVCRIAAKTSGIGENRRRPMKKARGTGLGLFVTSVRRRRRRRWSRRHRGRCCHRRCRLPHRRRDY